MTDKELLELAAIANGVKWRWTKCPTYGDMEVPGLLHHDGAHEVDYYFGWNPLEDNGEALELVVKLHLDLKCTEFSVVAGRYIKGVGVLYDDELIDEDDPCAAARRAIVRAAASIGQAKLAHEST